MELKKHLIELSKSYRLDIKFNYLFDNFPNKKKEVEQQETTTERPEGEESDEEEGKSVEVALGIWAIVLDLVYFIIDLYHHTLIMNGVERIEAQMRTVTAALDDIRNRQPVSVNPQPSAQLDLNPSLTAQLDVNPSLTAQFNSPPGGSNVQNFVVINLTNGTTSPPDGQNVPP